MIKTVANGEYVYEGYEINRFLPAVKLDKAIENHLHFELSYDGNIVNPLDHLNKELKN